MKAKMAGCRRAGSGMFILLSFLLLSISGCFLDPFYVNPKLEYSIPLNSIKLNLEKEPNSGHYRVYLMYIKDKATVADSGKGHPINIYDSNLELMIVWASYIYYDPSQGIMYKKLFNTSAEKDRYIYLGKGEIAGGEFKASFINGTRFLYHPNTNSQLDTASINIHLPEPMSKLILVEEIK